MAFRLATFNVLHGSALTQTDGGSSDVDRLAAACASLGADVLALQEIDRGQPRSGDVDQTAAVAAAGGARAWRFQPAIVGEPGGRWRAAVDGDDEAPTTTAAAADDDDEAPTPTTTATDSGPDGYRGAYGVGLVSRWPVREWHVLRLRAAPVRSPVFVPGRRAVILLPDEPRVVLAAELDHPSGPMVVATAHLSFVPGWNVAQLRNALRFLAGLGPRCVLLGDLNMPGGVARVASGREWRSLARVPTFPADRPRLQIDHALARGPVPAPVANFARRLDLSDHRALLVDLADLAQAPGSPDGPGRG